MDRFTHLSSCSRPPAWRARSGEQRALSSKANPCNLMDQLSAICRPAHRPPSLEPAAQASNRTSLLLSRSAPACWSLCLPTLLPRHHGFRGSKVYAAQRHAMAISSRRINKPLY